MWDVLFFFFFLKMGAIISGGKKMKSTKGSLIGR
jgi:hypothetical protein